MTPSSALRHLACTVVLVAAVPCVLSLQSQPVSSSVSCREKTTFQTAAAWKPSTDIRADVVMVYGTGHSDTDFTRRVQSWRDHGYATHFMTGIAWGEYQDYFTGQWDGVAHFDEGQRAVGGDTIWHGPLVPYIVPTMHYLSYFKERHIRPVIDAGIDAIFLEEPEFWVRSGYSEAFRREWEDYYGFPWRPQHESAENTYLSNKLKYHLYYRALDEAFTYAKAYGREHGMNVRCYVPTHSLINYSQWGIVSPEASLASMTSCDGYIAQVWTGTSRSANYYDGRERERVFEAAYLEYGCMESMTRPTGRKIFFLTDPIEDRPRDWDDYRHNYQATYTAQLLWSQIADYEVMPWPDRIYEGLYDATPGSDEKIRIPAFYSTQMQIMVNALNDMPLSEQRASGAQGFSVAMSNSMMFQTPVENYTDPLLSDFFGQCMPLLKRGIPVTITHLENTGYPDTWRDTRVLLLSYSNMKPMDPAAHEYIARWVSQGGTLIYSGRDDDAYQRVREWWNTGTTVYSSPSCHLFQQMGIPQQAPEGEYTFGKGKVYVLRHDPKEYVMRAQGDTLLWTVLRKACGHIAEKNSFTLQRGHYRIASVVDESPAGDAPLVLKGAFVDLFDPALPLLNQKIVNPGDQAFLYDLTTLNPRRPAIIAAASRQDEVVTAHRSIRFVSKSPRDTRDIVCVQLPPRARHPQCEVTHVDGQPLPAEANCQVTTVHRRLHGRRCNLLYLHFPNDPDGIHVNIHW